MFRQNAMHCAVALPIAIISVYSCTCVCACVRACVRASVRASVRACVCVWYVCMCICIVDMQFFSLQIVVHTNCHPMTYSTALHLMMLTFILTLWLPGTFFRKCKLVPDKFFRFSSLVPGKIFGFSLLVPDKIWPLTFPPTTDRMILFSEKSIGPMQKCCISFL